MTGPGTWCWATEGWEEPGSGMWVVFSWLASYIWILCPSFWSCLGKAVGLWDLGPWWLIQDSRDRPWRLQLSPASHLVLTSESARTWMSHSSCCCYTLSCNRTPTLPCEAISSLKPWAKGNSSSLKLLLSCILPQQPGKWLTQVAVCPLQLMSWYKGKAWSKEEHFMMMKAKTKWLCTREYQRFKKIFNV